ncbi:uncharacterized protein BP5553_01770 [Venustampulla echinocandica]|uniref:Uncharacterized protein n=1 Tax=Venustampulla echinocandica TaxID=2656787 RepID=A0A370U201_9HELO|nr:uncharacterized protein BP5553_01770 [Venustampulla echinocandica]RDL41791.1 hypothetical protein BP5553_01770 [Venustampulla echinocandica]
MPNATTSSGEKPSNSSNVPNPTTDPSIPTSGSAQATHTPNPPKTKTEAEEAADRLYEERIEEEYAKREGGA